MTEGVAHRDIKPDKLFELDGQQIIAIVVARLWSGSAAGLVLAEDAQAVVLFEVLVVFEVQRCERYLMGRPGQTWPMTSSRPDLAISRLNPAIYSGAACRSRCSVRATAYRVRPPGLRGS